MNWEKGSGTVADGRGTLIRFDRDQLARGQIDLDTHLFEQTLRRYLVTQMYDQRPGPGRTRQPVLSERSNQFLANLMARKYKQLAELVQHAKGCDPQRARIGQYTGQILWITGDMAAMLGREFWHRRYPSTRPRTDSLFARTGNMNCYELERRFARAIYTRRKVLQGLPALLAGERPWQNLEAVNPDFDN
jgi:hypothetical protein